MKLKEMSAYEHRNEQEFAIARAIARWCKYGMPAERGKKFYESLLANEEENLIYFKIKLKKTDIYPS